MYLKINWSVKTPWHRPGVGVARSRLWALVDGYSNINLKFFKVNALKELFWRLTISPVETIIKPTNSNQNLRQNIDTVCKSDLEVSSPFPNPGDHSKNVQCPPPPRPDDLRFSNTTGIVQQKKKTMWFIRVEVEQEMSAPPPKKILDPPL